MKKEKEKKKKGIHWQKSMAMTLVLILVVAAASFIITREINNTEEQRSFERLYEEAAQIAMDIKGYADNDEKQLERLAMLVKRYEDLASQELWEVLDSYSRIGMISRIEILLPDNTVLTKGGEAIDAGEELSFAREAALGAHITDRERDLTDGEYIVRHYMPVEKEGETIAMLCGIIELGTLPEELKAEPYGGEAAVYIIDGNTGDFLVDTWHDEPGNIWTLGEREMAPGYDHETLKQGMIDGRTGYVVFVSETIDRYLYFCYEPIEINEWRIALSVPEDVVFENAEIIRNILNIFLAFEAICFILYFIWMLHYVKSETSEKQRQLDSLNYIYDVEKLLFNAHEKQENITGALEKTAHITSAERIGLWMIGQPAERITFGWKKGEGAWEDFLSPEMVAFLLDYFRGGQGQFEAFEGKMSRMRAEYGLDEELRSLIAVPIEDMEGSVCGILAGCNLSNKKIKPGVFLKSVSFSFSMFLHNMNSYMAIKARGERDVLSGLYNRNRYEADLSKYISQYKKSLACIYIDVNGLHELNNEKGHEAGDEMLKTVAGEIRKRFGTEYTYRIGGDEFLAFAVGLKESTLERLKKEMTEELKKKNFYISVGIQWEKEVSSLDALIKKAEKKMYLEKKKFYQDDKNDRRERIGK